MRQVQKKREKKGEEEETLFVIETLSKTGTRQTSTVVRVSGGKVPGISQAPQPAAATIQYFIPRQHQWDERVLSGNTPPPPHTSHSLKPSNVPEPGPFICSWHRRLNMWHCNYTTRCCSGTCRQILSFLWLQGSSRTMLSLLVELELWNYPP